MGLAAVHVANKQYYTPHHQQLLTDQSGGLLAAKCEKWKMQERKMRYKIAGVENAGKENVAQDCRSGKCRKGKCRTRVQGWKMQERKMQHKISGVENAEKVACVIKLNQAKVNYKRV